VVRALSIDIGTTSVRTAIVSPDGSLSHIHQRRLTVATPNPGEVELDPHEIISLVFQLSALTLADGGECEVVGITNQRATTIVFDPTNGQAVGPALGWQDLRTVIDCLVLQSSGLRLAPNQSATKLKWLLNASGRSSSELRFATIETWVAWHLSQGRVFVTDHTNAGVNGLVNVDASTWNTAVLEALEIDPIMLPNIVSTSGEHGVATALKGAPRITALIGDQPASLFGQCRVFSGAKITFGTGAMLDAVRGTSGPTSMTRFETGCFPTVLRSSEGVLTWGLEGIVLSAGSCIEWLRDTMKLVESDHETEVLARSVSNTEGVSFVPAFNGLGTPYWDFGARGGFYGITRGSSRAHLVRAVLEGIAQRGADLVESAQAELGTAIDELRVDGGMSANSFFVQRLSDFTGLKVAVSSEREATTRGAGLMALVTAGALTLKDVESLWQPAKVFTPQLSDDDRQALRVQWRSTVARAEKAIPELSNVSF
jgi:glycerol kinase